MQEVQTYRPVYIFNFPRRRLHPCTIDSHVGHSKPKPKDHVFSVYSVYMQPQQCVFHGAYTQIEVDHTVSIDG